MTHGTRGVVFDMDDTLYLERDYVRSGFQAVAQRLTEPHRAFDMLWSDFESGVRGNTFDRLLRSNPAWAEECTVQDLVNAYREHAPEISLAANVRGFLLELAQRKVPIGVLTDGPEQSQYAKVQALGLEKHTEHVLMTDTLGRAHWKPSPKGFEWMERALMCSGPDLVYIGDNPKKDFIAPNARGWATVRLRMTGQLRCDLESETIPATAQHEVSSWAALEAWIRDWLVSGK